MDESDRLKDAIVIWNVRMVVECIQGKLDEVMEYIYISYELIENKIELSFDEVKRRINTKMVQ